MHRRVVVTFERILQRHFPIRPVGPPVTEAQVPLVGKPRLAEPVEIGAEVILQRWRIVGEADEDQLPTGFGVKLGQSKLPLFQRPKTPRVGNLAGIAVVVEFPTMIWTPQPLAIAARSGADQTEPVRANIQKRPQFALASPHNERIPKQRARQKVALARQFCRRADAMPTWQKQPLDFATVTHFRMVHLGRGNLRQVGIAQKHCGPENSV